VAIDHPNKAAFSLQWRHMALASEALLVALDAYIAKGGGSRGARMLCSSAGDVVPHTREGELSAFRFLSGKPEHRQEQLQVSWHNGEFCVETKPLRTLDDLSTIFFEKNWPAFLTDEIYQG